MSKFDDLVIKKSGLYCPGDFCAQLTKAQNQSYRPKSKPSPDDVGQQPIGFSTVPTLAGSGIEPDTLFCAHLLPVTGNIMR